MVSDAVEENGHESKTKVFISYSRKDIAFADRLDAALRVRGFEPLIDRTDIYAFEEWWKRVEDLIVRADTIIFVLSPDAVKPATVALKEVAFAASLNKRFAPIVFRQVPDKDIPEALARLNFIFFDDPAQFEQSADKLAEALNTDISWIRQHTEFGEQARRWAQAKGPSGLLLRSPVLEQAERWIASRPPGAPTPTDEMQTFIRRSRQGATRRRNILTGSLAAGLVLALVLAGLAYWQRGVAVEQRDIATRNFMVAQDAAERLVSEVAQQVRNMRGVRSATVHKILEAGRQTYDELAALAPGDLGLQRSRLAMLNAFGESYLTVADFEKAHNAYRSGLAIVERLRPEERSDAQWQHEISILYNNLGNVFMAEGKLDQALETYHRALAITQEVFTGSQWQRDLWLSFSNVGNALKAQGKLEEALNAYREGLMTLPKEEYRGMMTHEEMTRDSRDRAASYNNVGSVLLALGRLDEALKEYDSARESVDTLGILFVDSDTQTQYFLSISDEGRGDVFAAKGKLDEAVKNYRHALPAREYLVNSDPTNTRWQTALAAIHGKLATAYERQGLVSDAAKELNAAAEVLRELSKSSARLVLDGLKSPSTEQWDNERLRYEREITRLQGKQQVRRR